MNFKDKKGFTIVEALVCFSLIGLLFIATLSSIGRNDHYDKLYWQAFNTLLQASMSASEEFEKENNYSEKWSKNEANSKREGKNRYDKYAKDGTQHIKRKYPGFLRDLEYKNDNTVSFCKRLTKYINTLDPEKECNSGEFGANLNITSTGGKIGVGFYDGFSRMDRGDDDTYNATNMEPSFKALNGQKFYISPVLSANHDPEGKFGIKERESFRFIVVDLNGDSKPNSQFIKSGKNPDLVLFAIDSMGNVIPLGLPEFSKAYINAMVYYPTDLDKEGKPLYPKVHSKVETLWHAKKMAWGFKKSDEAACSAEGSGARFLQNISAIEPLSQSTKFYYNAMYCVDKLKTCTNKNIGNDKIYADEDYIYLISQFLYKGEGSSEVYDYMTTDSCGEDYTSLDEDNGCNTVNNLITNPRCAIDFKH